jgi:hypothetical protein
MDGNELEASEQALTPRQLRAAQELRISKAKNDALEISLTAIAADLERRQADGSLTADLATMKTGAVLGQLTRIAAAIKQSALLIMPNGQMPARDATSLKARSAVQLSDAQRAIRRKEAEAIDAQIVEPE